MRRLHPTVVRCHGPCHEEQQPDSHPLTTEIAADSPLCRKRAYNGKGTHALGQGNRSALVCIQVSTSTSTIFMFFNHHKHSFDSSSYTSSLHTPTTPSIKPFVIIPRHAQPPIVTYAPTHPHPAATSIVNPSKLVTTPVCGSADPPESLSANRQRQSNGPNAQRDSDH
ncbi:hypothetical protein BCR44DRAFT_1106431 [Catenaria anguillulae PL171]|uniref:Uncharacterized protein n=1 Tax=Catenaria anguillulae PL171 TaxID=765915 RepID=A0A1Y2HPL4_9FUNG|nr:hypothetical protein BCR44DRAFT_1106431 [Catenaria anguillulae PL171]